MSSTSHEVSRSKSNQPGALEMDMQQAHRRAMSLLQAVFKVGLRRTSTLGFLVEGFRRWCQTLSDFAVLLRQWLPSYRCQPRSESPSTFPSWPTRQIRIPAFFTKRRSRHDVAILRKASVFGTAAITRSLSLTFSSSA